ncbi:MAG: 2-oxo acid dehydrogenase subunit E2 [Thaumarchaeota archaeon]|nr:2-oxo acid dehydrogenase subunit E2 [Nitrososphaerota archaeon]
MQIPSPKSGKVSKILAKEGEMAKVGQVIVVIDDEGGRPASQEAAGVNEPGSPASSATQVQITEAAVPAGEVLATPATRRMAREMGVDLTEVTGTGPRGRITEEDLRAAAKAGPQKAASALAAKEERVPLRGIRKIIAERMAKSSTTAAHVTHVDEADMTELLLLREAFKGSAEKRGVKLTFLPFIIRGIIPALKEFPYVNATLDESGNVVLKRYYNMGIAVDTEQGLIVAAVRDVDKKDIFDLAKEIEGLAGRARAGQLSLEEVHGSTFTITNVGAIGGLFATPIINYPEVAILGTHKIAKRPVVRNGKVEVRDMIYLSLTFDHRIIDGAYAARFMNKVVQTLQDPKKLLAEIL